MKAKTLALFARHEIQGCVQADYVGDHYCHVYIDPFDFQRPSLSAFCARYRACIDSTIFTNEYIQYILVPIDRTFYRPDKRKQIIFKLQRDTDADIIKWLDSKENIHEYLRKLIRADMTQADDPDIIRCKDCMHWDISWKSRSEGEYYCPMIDHVTPKDFFCADGELCEEARHDS